MKEFIAQGFLFKTICARVQNGKLAIAQSTFQHWGDLAGAHTLAKCDLRHIMVHQRVSGMSHRCHYRC